MKPYSSSYVHELKNYTLFKNQSIFSSQHTDHKEIPLLPAQENAQLWVLNRLCQNSIPVFSGDRWLCLLLGRIGEQLWDLCANQQRSWKKLILQLFQCNLVKILEFCCSIQSFSAGIFLITYLQDLQFQQFLGT